jgi:hypothetical protein
METLEQAHTQQINDLQVHREMQIGRLEEIHDSDMNALRSHLLQRMEETNGRVEV